MIDAHLEYIAAGASVITTHNFAATRHNLAKLNLQADAAAITAAAAANAVTARKRAGKPAVRIAGCLPPLNESYAVHGLPPASAIRDEYASIVEALAPHVDLFLAETLSTLEEATAAVAAADAIGAWQHLRHGSTACLHCLLLLCLCCWLLSADILFSYASIFYCAVYEFVFFRLLQEGLACIPARVACNRLPRS